MGDHPPNPQFSLELGSSFFSTADRLKALISAASRDNVQPQAILAAEQLGGHFLISAERIDEAVTALHGNDSVRLESVKSVIGLSSGGIRYHTRQSSSLIAVFAICAACKLCYLDEEIGSMLYEMMSILHLPAKYPVSAAQLYQFVKQLSGHSESIVPFMLMHEIAVKVDGFRPGLNIFFRMDTRVLAKLICNVFEYYRDADVKELTLNGHDHGVWLATVLLWLIGEHDARLSIYGNHVRGSRGAKVTINVDPSSKAEWNLTVWKLGSNPKDYTYLYDDDEGEPIHRLPLISTKSYFDHYYGWASTTVSTREGVARLTRIVSEVLIQLVCHIGCICLPDESAGSCSTKYGEVVPLKWLSSVGQIMEEYGWQDHSEPDSVQELYEGILALLRSSRMGSVGKETRDLVRNECYSAIYKQSRTGFAVDAVFNPAMYIATNALLTSTSELVNGQRYIEPFYEGNVEKTETLYFSFLTSGLDIMSFRMAAFERILPGFRERDGYNLVVSNNGYVAAIEALWSCSTRKRDALSIKVCKGDIKQDDVIFDRITEAAFDSYIIVESVPLTLSIENSGTPENRRCIITMPKLDLTHQLMTTFSSTGTRLQVKTYLVQRNSSEKEHIKQKVSWIDSANELATAIHFGLDYKLYTQEHEKYLTDLFTISLMKPIWVSTPSSVLLDDEYSRSVMLTRGRDLLRYFCAGIPTTFVAEDIHLIIRHNAPMLQCILQAMELGEPWMIIE